MLYIFKLSCMRGLEKLRKGSAETVDSNRTSPINLQRQPALE